MTSQEAAKYLGISRDYLQNMRTGIYRHEGPPFEHKIVGHRLHCIYNKEQLDEWVSKHSWKRLRKPKVSRKKKKVVEGMFDSNLYTL